MYSPHDSEEICKLMDDFKYDRTKTYDVLSKYENNVGIETLNKIYFNNIIKPYKESEKIIDMHAHTNASDGDLTSLELIQLAIAKKISVLAITDHNTVEGLKNINSPLISDSGIKIINGIEFSVKRTIGQMHILGYGIDIYNETLNKKLNDIKSNCINKVLSILEVLKKDYNITFSYEDIKSLINVNHNLGRVDVAHLLVKRGYAKNIPEVFEKYLVSAYEKVRTINKGLTYEECINLILSSGGIPVLAHPKTLKLNEKEFLILLKDMLKSGLMGMECYHSSFTKEEMAYYLEIANRYNLLVSGGSDFHGSAKPDVSLGTGKNNNLYIRKLSILDRLK